MDFKQVCDLIPDGTSTKSRMPCRYVEGVYPVYAESRPGAKLWADGREYIDYTMGLGAVVLGNAYPRVNEVVKDQLDKGNVIGAPSKMEGELAAKLIDIVPSAEMVRFTNTGSEAAHAAVKIARAYTNRERVLCCGFHGWFSWYQAVTDDNLGCTEDEKAKIEALPYNDIDAWERAFDGPAVAAVIMEPYVFDAPKDGFLNKVRNLCTKHGTVLIFDEVVTGFRTPGWTAQKMFDVTPDLTCLGKAMANGVTAISVVCGGRELMQTVCDGCFVSSTFAANPIALAASLATIRTIEKYSVIEQIWRAGSLFKTYFDQVVSARSLQGVTVKGYPCRTWFDFPTGEHKSLFWQECLNQGVWFGFAQFVSYAHTDTELAETVRAMKMGIDKVATHFDNPKAALLGRPARGTARLTVHDTPKPVAGPPKTKYICEACAHRFNEPYRALMGRHRNKPACPQCHKIEITENA